MNVETCNNNPELTFDPENHQYWLRGKQIPSVTWVLRVEGVIDDRYYTDYGLVRGIAVHKGCELIAKGTVDWRSVDYRILPYLEAYQDFLQKTGFIPEIIEKPFINEDLEYGTKPDQIGTWDSQKTVLELKTGKIPKWACLQTAGQAMAVCPQPTTIKRMAIELKADGTWMPQFYDDAEDLGIFMMMLGSAVWKLNNKLVTL